MKHEAMFYKKLEDGSVHCHLCSHYCRIAPGETGFCKVRENEYGELYTHAYGETVARHVDPIEKKPLYHFLPGTLSYSIATAGCNFHCPFCQNWLISQITPERNAVGDGRPFPPADVSAEAALHGCASIAYTYTEPAIFFEYARDIALPARDKGIKNVFVTNGYMTRRALDDAASWLDAANVDLKAWSDLYYREVCKGRLEPVLDTIRHLKRLGIWVEVTTLVIPGDNDADEDLEGIAGFIAGVGVEIPWHISRFHPGYQFGDHKSTPMETLEKAARIGRDAGLKYVYIGNVSGENVTQCPGCRKPVVQRSMMGLSSVNIEDGKCRHCGALIDGVWIAEARIRP